MAQLGRATDGPAGRTTAYVHQLWDGVLLRSALTLREALTPLPAEAWAHYASGRDLLVMLDVMEAELTRRGLIGLYVRGCLVLTFTADAARRN